MLCFYYNAVVSTQCWAFINALLLMLLRAHNAVLLLMLLRTHNAVRLMLLGAHNTVLLMVLGAHDAVLLMLVRAQNAALLIFSCLFTGSAESSHRNDTNPRKTQFRVVWFPAEIE